MKRFALYGLFLLLPLLSLGSLLSSGVYAVGLQEFIQNNQTGSPAETASDNFLSNTGNTNPNTPYTSQTNKTSQLTHIIEMVVAGVVASALIISLLVLFLGRWIAHKDRLALKVLRNEAEKEKEHITAAVTTVREQEKETTQIVHAIRKQAQDISKKQEKIETQEKAIDLSFANVESQQNELEQVSSNVSNRMDEIQSYWDEQLKDTVSAIQQVQSGLNENLSKVDDGLEKMQRQKSMSEELMQDFLKRHNEQNTILENNSIISDKVSESLEETLKESTHLLKLLKKQQKDAEQALKHFNEELSGYEEQAYEQFDSSFQVADIARQELTANIEESRKHLESMRRYEEHSHGINVQTQKHLETLDFTKIVKLSHTLNSTQDMFTDLRDSVEEAQNMLDELKDIETDVRETANNVVSNVKKTDSSDITLSNNNEAPKESKKSLETKKLNPEVIPSNNKNSKDVYKGLKEVEIDYKIASGDNTPLSFFKHLKDTAK